MEPIVERELTLEASIEEVWRTLAKPGWLGEDAVIELNPAGEVRAGARRGFVEEVDAPQRLVFWWSEPDDEATRVELRLEAVDEGTVISVSECRPLAFLDAVGSELPARLGVFGPPAPELVAR